ncbi:MAG: MBL fold metallo-hydrolase [Candidatus Hodarchaeales archaeon]
MRENNEAIKAISDSIFLVQGYNNGKFPFSHSILILNDQKGAILIDTGCGIETLQNIKETYDIYRIINSHTHPDHSAGNWVFDNSIESIYVPREGFKTSGNLLALSNRFTEPGELASFWRNWIVDVMKFKDCKPTSYYDENTTIEVGDILLQPIYTPGHSIDHYCFYESTNKILFSFDIDLTPFGPWYGHRESSITEFKSSLHRIKELDIKILVSGHKGIIKDNISEQIERFSQIIEKRSEKIQLLLQSGIQSPEQLTEMKPIYGKFPYAEPLLRYWEKQMILKHIQEIKAEKI